MRVDILAFLFMFRYLPVKTEIVICCPLTPLQLHLYNMFVKKQEFTENEDHRQKKTSSDKLNARGLSAITQLKKVTTLLG